MGLSLIQMWGMGGNETFLQKVNFPLNRHIWNWLWIGSFFFLIKAFGSPVSLRKWFFFNMEHFFFYTERFYG